MFGTIDNPFRSAGNTSSALSGSQNGTGLFWILNNLFKFLIVMAGVYTFLNIILAGYGFISAGGDPKNISKAWEKIWQSLVGLLVVAGSVLLAMLFGRLIFGDETALISPRIYAP